MKATTITKFVVEKVLSKEMEDMEKSLSEKGGKAFVDLGKQFEKLIEKYFAQVYQQVINYLDTLPELNIIQKVEYWEIEDLEKVKLEFGTVLYDGFEQGAIKQQNVLGAIGFSTDLDNDYAIERAKQQAGQLVSNVDATTKKRIGNLITQSLTTGLTKSDMIKSLQSDYSFSKYRAKMIVNNELGNAFVSGSRKQWEEYQKKTGIEGYKQRVTQEDDRVSELCTANGEEGWISANQPHSSGHMHPLGHINCRCDEQYLPIPPDKMEDYLNEDDYPTYDSAFIAEDKLPKNYDAYSLKVAPPAFIESLGAKITYQKPTGEEAFFNPNTLEIQIGGATTITQKHNEIHELGHAFYMTTISENFENIERMTEVMGTATKEYTKNQGKVLDLLKKAQIPGEIKKLLTEIGNPEYKYVQVAIYNQEKIITQEINLSEKFINDLYVLKDMVGMIEGDSSYRPANYYKDVYNQIQEMSAYIAEVYFYDNKLLEKALPKTYNAMKKFYEEIGFNF